MNKEAILAALDDIQANGDSGKYHDELQTLIGIMPDVSEEEVTTAWNELRTTEQ